MPASILVAVAMRKLSLLLLACAGFLAMTSAVSAQTVSAQGLPKPMPLYNGTPPGALGHGTQDIPMLYVMLPKKPTTSAAMLVIPGGGYEHVALGHEGFQIGEWLRAQGMPAIVLDYRVAPYHYPIEIEDGMRAMRVIRAHPIASAYGALRPAAIWHRRLAPTATRRIQMPPIPLTA